MDLRILLLQPPLLHHHHSHLVPQVRSGLELPSSPTISFCFLFFIIIRHHHYFGLMVYTYADDQFYAFTRGNTFVALTNGGSNQGQISRNITYQPYSNGQKLCNMYAPLSRLPPLPSLCPPSALPPLSSLPLLPPSPPSLPPPPFPLTDSIYRFYQTDCVTVVNGAFEVYLDSGESKVYQPM